jgi:hypothetical protein
MLLNAHFGAYAQSFACDIQEQGITSAVSIGLGSGTNSDGWIEGLLVGSLHMTRPVAENAVNLAHTALFGGARQNPYSDCD